jgi:hypothetical protein
MCYCTLFSTAMGHFMFWEKDKSSNAPSVIKGRRNSKGLPPAMHKCRYINERLSG